MRSPLTDLPLTAPTAPGWAEVALRDPDALLRDHAHCELKAASAALRLLAGHPAQQGLVRPLLALAQEEMRHFREVLDVMDELGVRPGRPAPDRYVNMLRRSFCSEGSGVGALGDQLLVAAFIEARSCERFRLLAAVLETPDGGQDLPPPLATRLGEFYARLGRAEARHWAMFRDLAASVLDATALQRRLAELGPMEARIIASLPPAARIH
jgi:tRNA-(ms[2]io[6]A)-hydroxylase